MKTVKRLRHVALAPLVLFAASAVARQETFLRIPAKADILHTLRPDHPRLLATAEIWARVKNAIEADARLGAWHKTLIGKAEETLAQAPSRYEIPDGRRLLRTSRRVLGRVQLLAYAYRTTHDQHYVDRAWAELSAAAAFQDWNPSHFLDTGEMTAAFGIGYDWLYDAWSDEQRRTLRDAIVRLGLTPGQRSYQGKESYGWWVRARHNWNQVCNGGLALGALAIADEEPALAAEILHAGLESLPLAMREFAPDGGWGEGPGYWSYATTYNVQHLAALQTALGTEFGFAEFPGFSRTGEFPLFISAPGGRTFNYADGHENPISAPQLFWFASRFDQPGFAAFEASAASPLPLDVIWAAQVTIPKSMSELPLDRCFQGIGVVTMRSAWDDPDAIFVGLKGGSNAVNHSHLDLGSFVLEATGVRWGLDLGSDNYNMPAYFGDQRWTYYRLRAEGQNTIVLDPSDGPEQNPRAGASVIETSFQAAESSASVDLSRAYAKALAGGRLTRRIGLERIIPRVRIEDAIEPGAGAIEAWWFMHTHAEIAIAPDGRSAILTQDGKRLAAELVSPPGAAFSVMDARPLPTSPDPEMQNKNDGVRKLTIRTRIEGPTTLRVVLRPLGADEPIGNDRR